MCDTFGDRCCNLSLPSEKESLTLLSCYDTTSIMCASPAKVYGSCCCKPRVHTGLLHHKPQILAGLAHINAVVSQQEAGRVIPSNSIETDCDACHQMCHTCVPNCSIAAQGHALQMKTVWLRLMTDTEELSQQEISRGHEPLL